MPLSAIVSIGRTAVPIFPPRGGLGNHSRRRATADLVERAALDRRLANRNIRTALIAGAIALVIFALSFLVGFVY